MNEVKKNLLARIELCDLIIERGTKYFAMIKDVVARMDMTKYAEFNRAVDLAGRLSAEIGKMGSELSMRTMYDLYDRIAQIDTCINTIYEVVESPVYTKMILFNMSQTYGASLLLDKNFVLDAIQRYHAISDEEIFTAALAHINVKANVLACTLFIEASGINRFMIELIRETLKWSKNERLLRVVERQKNLILGAQRLTMLPPESILQMSVRYGLYPLTRSMPAADLFARLGAPYSADLGVEEALRMWATKSRVGVIICAKVLQNPIEFDSQGLISLKYVTENNLKTSLDAGLNKKILERFNTIKILPGGHGTDLRMTRFVPEGARDLCIVETLNGDLYRILGRVDNDLTPVDTVRGLVDGLSLRPHEYNRIHYETIVDHCYDPAIPNILIEYENEKREVLQSEVIKARIIADFTEDFEMRLGGKTPSRVAELRAMILDEDVMNQILMNRLTKNMGSSGKESAEVLVTYVVKFDEILNTFRKELRTTLDAEHFAKVLKEYRGAELSRVIKDIYKGLITKVVNELDRGGRWTEYDISLKEFILR